MTFDRMDDKKMIAPAKDAAAINVDKMASGNVSGNENKRMAALIAKTEPIARMHPKMDANVLSARGGRRISGSCGQPFDLSGDVLLAAGFVGDAKGFGSVSIFELFRHQHQVSI